MTASSENAIDLPGPRKIIAFVLLLLVAFPLTGFVLFYIQEKSIRAEMKRAFKSKELSTVHLTTLKWYEADEELIVNGTLFDVSSVEKLADGSYLVKGLYDHQEKALYQLLDDATEDNQKSPLLLEYAACFVSVHATIQPFTQQLPALIDNIHSTYLERLIPQFQPGILTPPPKYFSVL